MSWLVDTLLVTGELIALVLVLRRPVARAFGPAMAYALWALPLLRLIIPPITLPSAPAEAAPVFVTVLADPVPVSAAPAPAWTFAPLFQAVWLAGALAYLGWRVWQYRAMRRTLLAGAIGVGDAEGVRLIEAPEVRSPVAFGIQDRVIALPPGFMAQTPRRERDLAIAHELEHHRGRDLAVNIAMQPLLALHWFNPLAWAGWRALRRDQEAACDARVLAGREADTRAVYGRLIAAFACNPSPALASPLACPILHEKSIVHRLRSLTMTEPTKTRRLAGRLLIGAAVLALPLTATITYAANEEDAPQAPEASEPPAPPAPPAAPDKQKVHKIVIIDNPGGSTLEDSKLHTRVIERNGKTIVLKTKEPLSDKEAEERIAKAEAGTMEADAFVMHGPEGAHVTRNVVVIRKGDGKGGEWSAKEGGNGGKSQNREVHTFTFTSGGAGATSHGTQGEVSCSGGEAMRADAENNADGKQRKAHVMICSPAGDKTARLAAMRKARDKVASDPNLGEDLKKDVLSKLDAQIERMSKDG